MNKCSIIQNNFIELLEGTLAPEKKDAAEKHLASCASCYQLFHEICSTYSSLDSNESVDPGMFFYTRVDQKLKNKIIDSYGSPLRSRVVQLMALCFIGAAGIFAGIHIGRSISEVSISIPVINNNDVLGSYANEYYLNGSGEESIENLLNNE